MRNKLKNSPNLYFQQNAKNFDHDIRAGNNAWIAQYAADIAEKFLNTINMAEHTIFEKSRKKYEQTGHSNSNLTPHSSQNFTRSRFSN